MSKNLSKNTIHLFLIILIVSFFDQYYYWDIMKMEGHNG